MTKSNAVLSLVTDKSKPSDDVLKVIENILRNINGKPARGVAIAVQHADGSIGTAFSAEDGNLMTLLGGVSVLQKRILRDIEDDYNRDYD